MSLILPDLMARSAARSPGAEALKHRDSALSYGALWAAVEGAARRLVALGLARGERVAVYLDKRPEAVVAMFGAAAAGGAFVPVAPVLRPAQVAHILKDCNVRVLVTSTTRLETLAGVLPDCADLRQVIVVDGDGAGLLPPAVTGLAWDEALGNAAEPGASPHRVIDQDMAAIFYTSGSTGLPKGVVLSHRNLVAGAQSVSAYLENVAADRILSVLPLNFDAGFSQLTTAFHVGAAVVLLDYSFPRDVARLAARERITGIAGVPPLWSQLADVDWPGAAVESLRYFTTTGDRMPRPTLDRLRAKFPNAKPYLMYGLTESFRSTYLPPSEIDRRPDSIGKAVPNAEILVVRPDGTLCGPDEPGELVHRGAFVALGYWNDPERTAERFRPAPARPGELPIAEMAVWSGDTVRMDADGFLYFLGRGDAMLKTSGYRVSPTEIEQVVLASAAAGEAVVVGVPHATLGQAVVVVATPREGATVDQDAILDHCRRELPAYMVPRAVVVRDVIPRNANGKIDRKALAEELADLFAGEAG